MHSRKGYTFIELTMVIIVVAIVIVCCSSNEDNGGKEQARMAAEKIEADVAYARSASIARPDNPMVIKIDTPNNRYWLASSSDPNTPITHPRTGKPYMINFGAGGTGGLDKVALVANNVGSDHILGFTTTGGTDQQTPALIQVAAGNATAEVSVSPDSGKVTIGTMLSNIIGLGGNGVSQGNNPGVQPTELPNIVSTVVN